MNMAEGESSVDNKHQPLCQQEAQAGRILPGTGTGTGTGVRGRAHTPLDLSEEEWNDIIKTNMTGTWLVSKYVCIRMRDAKQGGAVINISSIAGLNRGQVPRGLVYASAKVAINTMTKVSLLTETGGTKDDLRLPTDDTLLAQIKGGFE